MRSVVIFLALFLPNIMFGQSQNEMDSLKMAFEKSKDIESRISAASKLIENYSYNDPSRAKSFLDEALKLVEDNGYTRGKYQLYCEYTNYYNVNSNYDSAIYYANRALQLVEVLGDSTLYSVPYLHLTWSYSIKGDYDSATEVSLNNLEISKKIGDWSSLAESYFGMGNTYFYTSDLPKALEAYLSTDSILQIHNPYNMTLVNTNINIAQLLITDKQYDRASEYLDKSEEVAHYNKHDYSLASVELMRGILHTKAGNYEEAFPHLIKAEKFFKGFHSDFDLAETYYYLGQYYYETDDLSTSVRYHRNSVELHQKVEDPMGVANSQYTLGLIHGQQGQYGLAIEQVNKALVLYDETSIEQKVECLKSLSELYAQSNTYDEAFSYYEQYNSLRDTLLQRQNSEALNDLEIKYQTEKKEQEIALLSSQNELINQQKRNQRKLLLGGIGLTSLAGVFLFFLYQNRQKTNRKLKELDSLKSHFFANVSHEFRTPLTLISGPIEKRLKSDKLSKKDREQMQMVQRNSERLLGLVDQLLDLSKLEAGKYQIQVKQGNLGNLIRAIGESFQFAASQHQIDYHVEVANLQNAWYHKDTIEKILTNLLSNAFKYTPDSGCVTLYAAKENGYLKLDISNAPVESNPIVFEKVFERFYQAEEHNEGVGIGLSLVKELIEFYRGEIRVLPHQGDELKFSIRLPVAQRFFSATEVSSEPETELFEIKSKPTLPASEIEAGEDTSLEDDKREIILIVEDNRDVRELINESFNTKYRMLEAKDGEEGIAKALEWVPDLIISDIMMPRISGLQLCNRLKNDERTSHIPIILLTAKAGEEDQYKGLSTGAEAYITKPFKIRLLETRVQKLIESRKILRDRYSQEIILKPRDIAITDLDEQFLERVQNVMDTKLTESAFSIREFCEAVGMSRMQLHRKLKALTGLSASEFVRSQRLKLAANLLRSSKAQVAEIGYQVGFNDPSYFTKCFKEAYGCSPTEYSKRNTP